MNIRYIIISAIAVILGVGLLFLPEEPANYELEPQLMLEEIMDESRFISSDDLAKSIINGDPSIQLIDVRPETEFNKFHLPGAISVPLEKIMDEEFIDYFDQDIRKNIIYSNGTVYSGQAWMLLRRHKFPNLTILQGGLNNWAKTILQPVEPEQTASSDEFERYNFRKAAAVYFTGSKPIENKTVKKKKPIGRKKKKSVDGGC